MKLPKLPRLRLLTRVALALAAVGLLPLAISYFGLVGVNREALFTQVLNTHALAARTAAARVEAFLDTRLSLARGVAANRALADPRSPAAQELLSGSLQAWSDLGVEAVAVVNAKGEEVVRAQLKGASPDVAQALGLGGAGPVAAVPGTHPPVVRVSAPLPAAVGALVLVCSGAPLADVARPEELGGEAELAVADRGGRVVVGDARSLAPFPQGLIDAALAGRVAGAGRYHGRGGEEVLGAYAPVAVAGWAVLSSQPARVAEAVAARLRRRSALALGAALLLIAALIAVAWAAVVRPIRDLAREQRELAKAAPAPAGRDEIDDLRRSFEALRRGLDERRALDDVFLGRYQVIELLATGGMGAVFRGWDPRLQRAVALKTLRLSGDLPADKRSQRIEQLVREAVTAARFSHPNVVAVYDVEDAPEGAYIAMELVVGVSLERLLLHRGRLRPEEVIPLGAAIAHGLAAAHARDIVHRDVKPANVMLGRDGSIKVTDFGIADLIASSARAEGLVFGTPGYLPPEALRGSGHDRAGDLFALGVVLFESLSGLKPFGGHDVSDVIQNTLFGTVRPLRARVQGDFPPELESLVLQLLDREPDLRPSNAGAVAAELDRLAAARGLHWRLEESSSPPGTGETPAYTELTLEAQWMPTTRLATERVKAG
ncbi:MAG TPA: serine/threonine protein kinase [Thermoanaerobaculia bacterium]|nr:serine/threonine protein kinase [Thermoanaerobaculia bacterium]